MRYILIPKNLPLPDVLTDEDVPLDRESRAMRLRSLMAARRDAALGGGAEPMSGMFALNSLRRDLGGDASTVRILAGPEISTPATGVFVLDAESEEEVAAIAAAAGAEPVADEAIPLIAPDLAASERVAESSQALTAEDLWHQSAIGLTEARRNGFGGTGAGVTVAVLDTGVAPVEEVRHAIRETVAVDLETFTSQILPDPKDTHGHGTHVAGLIAGRNVGIAPDAKVVSVIALPKGEGRLTRYITSLEFAGTQEDVAIINMSAGRLGYHPNMRQITKIHQRLGTLAFMATGNDGQATSRSPGNYPEVISVGASNAQGGVWNGSSGQTLQVDGTDRVVPDLVAPGEAVTSCVKDGGYESWDGTSMAAPIMSGLACLMLERFPKMTRRELMEAVYGACEDLGLEPVRQGRGRIALPPSLLTSGAGV